MNKIEVINKLKPIIDNLAIKHNWLIGKKSMAMAQIICESGWLKSAPKNNCLGIKYTKKYPESRKQMLWTKEWLNGKYISVLAPFLTFESIEQCIEEGYIRILKLARYKETRDSIDWWDATNFIRLNGYATSPTYTNTLRNLILRHKLYTIDWFHNYNDELTENFIWGETFSNIRFKGKTYRRIIEPPKIYWIDTVDLVVEIQKGRDYIGKSFVVNRWYSIDSYNSYIGGVPNSQHKISNAADIANPRGYTSYLFYRIIDRLTDCTGFGIGRRYCHFDRKKNVKRRIWYY